MLDITKFGPRLRALRTEHGETQEQMAIIFDCSRPTYGFYESGESFPKLDTFIKICNYYKVPAGYFFEETKDLSGDMEYKTRYYNLLGDLHHLILRSAANDTATDSTA